MKVLLASVMCFQGIKIMIPGFTGLAVVVMASIHPTQALPPNAQSLPSITPLADTPVPGLNSSAVAQQTPEPETPVKIPLPADSPEVLRFPIKEFRLQGNTLLSGTELQNHTELQSNVESRAKSY